MSDKADQLIQECKRQAESCLYTSTALFMWLRELRVIRTVFVILPLILGGFTGGRLLFSADPEAGKALSATCAFLAGLLPSIYSALKFDDKLRECANLAAEFKNLQDRFRQAALVAAQKPFSDFEAQFNQLMNRMEVARKPSITPPERIFKSAQRKVQGGDYDFDADLALEKSPPKTKS